MTYNNEYWMKHTIKLANKKSTDSIVVAASVVNNDELVDYSCNDNGISWAKDLIKKLKAKNINKIDKLFLTINTYENNHFDLNDLLKEYKINMIFLGLPDPRINSYLKDDPIIHNNVYRFSEALQEKVFKQNSSHYKDSMQNLKYSKYFYTHRVLYFVQKELAKYGIEIENEEFSNMRNTDVLAAFISKKYMMAPKKAYELITGLISEAFDYKYSDYDYSYDIRSINTNWSKTFEEVCEKANVKSLDEINILNVGVGSGIEANKLFSNCKNITFADIAPNGLKKIKELIPSSVIVNSRAEDLSTLKDNSYELYVSLRTYNSSFFNIEQAIKEAYRVLKNNATAIISISNGFLNTTEKKIMPGIIVPKLGFVDLYRGIDIVKELSNIMAEYNFKNIELTPTNGELYISARVEKE